MSRFWIACWFLLIAIDGQTTRGADDPTKARPKPADSDAPRAVPEITDSDLPGMKSKRKVSEPGRRQAEDGDPRTLPGIDRGIDPGIVPSARGTLPFGLVGREPKIFDFKISPKTPLRDLLPAGPKTLPKSPGVFNEDLAKVRELMFDEPFGKDVKPDDAMEKIAHQAAKINFLNSKAEDGFIRELRANRSDLQGLPFLLGKDCRSVDAAFMTATARHIRLAASLGRESERIWKKLLPLPDDVVARTFIQVIPPGAEYHDAGLARFLAEIEGAVATQALAGLAIFSPDSAVRDEATSCLKKRSSKDYTDFLTQGLNYPLPIVAQRAAEAVIQLKCLSALPELVNVLERPDPRAPRQRTVNGKQESIVRELVKLNHHRNCLLCHAPADAQLTFLRGPAGTIPVPGEPFPPSSQYYTIPPSPDLVVRVDVTYLRQDFSLMMPVEDAAPWPEMQRFDFLVRTRVLSSEEAKEIADQFSPAVLSPYHRYALRALRQLTGQDAGNTAKAWRELLAAR